MKHATANALDQLEPMLGSVRALGSLKEKSRGVFYLGSRAALHFHEDPEGLFADFRGSADWQRFPVNSKKQSDRVLRVVASFLAGPRSAAHKKR